MNWPFWISATAVAVLLPTGYAAKIGAPYAPTRRRALDQALKEMEIGKGDTLIDLGAGDGSVVIQAARRGAEATGYELSPVMWLIAKIRAWPHKQAAIAYKNFYKQKLPTNTTHIFAFLLPASMPRLKSYLSSQHLPHAKYLLVHAFPFKDGTKPVRVIRTQKSLPVYVYDLEKLTKP